MTNPTKIAEKIFKYDSYWQKIELLKIRDDHPDLYSEVVSELEKLEKQNDIITNTAK